VGRADLAAAAALRRDQIAISRGGVAGEVREREGRCCPRIETRAAARRGRWGLERNGSPDGKWRPGPLFESGKPQQTRHGLRNWERHRGQSDFRDDGSANIFLFLTYFSILF